MVLFFLCFTNFTWFMIYFHMFHLFLNNFLMFIFHMYCSVISFTSFCHMIHVCHTSLSFSKDSCPFFTCSAWFISHPHNISHDSHIMWKLICDHIYFTRSDTLLKCQGITRWNAPSHAFHTVLITCEMGVSFLKIMEWIFYLHLKSSL